MNLSTRILLGLLAGLVAGILHSMADGLVLTRLPEWIEPIGTLWVNLHFFYLIDPLSAHDVQDNKSQKNLRQQG